MLVKSQIPTPEGDYSVTKNRYQNWLIIALLSAGHFLSDFYNTFLPALLPTATASLGLSLTGAGSLVMIFSFTASILQPILGYFIDKHGWSWLIIWTIPVSGLFICLAGMATSVWQLTVCVTLSGLSLSLFHPLGSAMLGKAADEQNKNMAMSLFIGGGNIGVAIAPAIVLAFLFYIGSNYLLWLAVPGIAIGLAFYLTGVHKIPLTKTASQAAPTTAWYKSVSMLKLNLVMGIRSWPQAAIPNFLALWLVSQGHSVAMAGGLLTAFLAGGAVGSIGGGFLSNRIGRKASIILALTVTIPLLYCFLNAPSMTVSSYVLLFAGGAALQGTLPVSIVWAQEMLPANAAMASGMMLGLSFGLGGLGAALTGLMADFTGLHTALLWSLAPLLAGILITWSIPSKCVKANAAQELM